MATAETASIGSTPSGERQVTEMQGATTRATSVIEPLLDDGAYWQPGFLARFPWAGFGALVGVLLCLTATIIVLVESDGRPQTETYHRRAWPKAVAPNVLVSIFNSIANICFGIAISNGIAISWWRKALKGGTIKDLNKSWKFSSSVLDAVLSGKAFNVIALSALAAKMTLIDSTLFQKAIGTFTAQDYIGPKENFARGYINKTFPLTGMGSAESILGLQPAFSRDIEIWQLGGGVYPNQFPICTTAFCTKTEVEDQIWHGVTAYLTMKGAGLEFDCLDSVTANINASALVPQWMSNTTTNTQQMLFTIDFTVHHANANPADIPEAWDDGTDYIIMKTAYSVTQDDTPESDGLSACPGTLVTKSCRLRAAIVKYPIQVVQPGSKDLHIDATAQIGTNHDHHHKFWEFSTTGKQQNYFKVTQTLDIQDYPSIDPVNSLDGFGNNTYSGLAAALQTYLGGYAYILKNHRDTGYIYNQSGSAQTYLDNLPFPRHCSYKYSNPFEGGTDLVPNNDSKFIAPGLISQINSIMWGLATDVSSMDPGHTNARTYFTADIYADTVHYMINDNYMYGAIASTLVCILCVLPSFYGFWELGRKVTLGPFEIAAAFRAPNLSSERFANAPVDTLIEHVGDREVRFGHIVSGRDAGRIGVAELEYVQSATRAMV